MNIVTAVQNQMLQSLIAALGTGAVAGAKPGAAIAGQVVEGRLTQLQPDGQAVLQTKAGPVALVLPEPGRAAQGQSSAPLVNGQVIRLEIGSVLPDGRLSGRILPQAAPTVAGQPQPGAAPSVSLQVGATLVEPRAQNVAPQGLPAVPPPISAATAKAVAAPISATALSRQAGLAPLFANLAVVVASPTVQAQLPRELITAVQELLGARLPLEHAGEPARLREAFRNSGLFHEAFMQAATAQGQSPDLKGQLLGLKALLGQLLPRAEGEPVGDLLKLTPSSSDAGAKATAQAAPQPPGLPPPRAHAPLSAQGSALPTLAADSATPAQIVRTLAQQVEGALDRQTLTQVASLPPSVQDIRQDGGTIQRWLVEIPIAHPGGTQVMPLEIEEDRRGQSAADPGQKVWRVRFALDDAALGPIHGAVTLVNRKIAVTFWAENEITRATLRAGSEGLVRTLTATRFAEAEIDVLAGAPPQPRAEPAGGFLDQRA